MTIDAKGNVASYDNYYPFGEIMPGLSSNTAIADAKYKFTGKERDVETGLDYFGARYYESWSGRWMSVDPLAKKYPGWSPYNYVEDNPTGSVDPNGAQVKPSWWENIGTSGNNLTLPPLTLAGNNESNPASISTNGFASSRRSSIGSSFLSFAQRTASMASTTYFWAGVATGVGAGVAGYFGQLEIAEPLADASATSFALSAKAARADLLLTGAQAVSGQKSGRQVAAEVAAAGERIIMEKFAGPETVPAHVVGKYLVHENEEAIKEFIMNSTPQPAH